MRQTPNVTVNVTIPRDNRRLARLDDGRAVLVPAEATFTPTEPSPNYPPITITIDAHDGQLVVTNLTLTATADQPINSDAVRRWSLPALTIQAASVLALHVTPDGGYEPDDAPEAEKFVARAVRRRTNITDERLQEAADLYQQGGIQAVEDVLYRSRSQAYRLIAKARKQGLIPDEPTPGQQALKNRRDES